MKKLTIEHWFSIGAVAFMALSVWNAITSASAFQMALNIVQAIGWTIASYAFWMEAE